MISDLENILKHEQDFLDRCILRATQYAKSVLRSRWPVDFPFGDDAPGELRDAVAAIAVFRALQRIAEIGGVVEMVDRLEAGQQRAIRWLNDLAASEVQVEAVLSTNVGRVVRCGPPRGEAGFSA